MCVLIAATLLVARSLFLTVRMYARLFVSLSLSVYVCVCVCEQYLEALAEAARSLAIDTDARTSTTKLLEVRRDHVLPLSALYHCCCCFCCFFWGVLPVSFSSLCHLCYLVLLFFPFLSVVQTLNKNDEKRR